MINSDVLNSIINYSEAFKSSTPFKHVCIDNFLDTKVANDLLAEMPDFDDSFAINEFGKVGPKCTMPDISKISEKYKDFYNYISSKEFLESISEITGIDNLIFDPKMFGGGIHLNKYPASLDPHVDFNLLNGLHRRLNLLIYLNENWDEKDGGVIELYEKPHSLDKSAEFKSYNCTFNRCVIFETNEESWHGFKPISNKNALRKLISIYLYTETRDDVKVGEHGTFYMPYTPDQILANQKTSSDNSYPKELIDNLITARDNLLDFSYRNIRKIATQLLDAQNSLKEMEKNYSLQLLGAQNLMKEMEKNLSFQLITQELPMSTTSNGIYHDKWVNPENNINLKFYNQKRINKFVFQIFNPNETMEINFKCNDILLGTKSVKDDNKIEFNLSDHIIDNNFLITLNCSNSFNSDCGRKLSVILLRLEVNDTY